jgi:hypothetical protein
MARPILLSRLARSASLAMLALAGLAAAQEGSVILKSLDQLEKRVSRIETEMGHLRKAGPAPAAPAAFRPDTAAAALAVRLDSVSARLARLEKAPAPAAVPAASGTLPAPQTGAPATDAQPSPAKDSIAVLIREVRALTAALKSGPLAAAPAKAAPPPPTITAAAPAIAKSAPQTIASVASPAVLALKGDIQIQGERKFTSQGRRNNLDDFWGRLNFGAEYDDGKFQSKINLRIYPEGFGFEPLTGATFDTTGQGSLKLQTQPSPRMVINHAWVRYGIGPGKLRLGRFETVETKSDNFGNYVDLGPTGKFMSRPATHNALEGTAPAGAGTVSVLLGTADNKLNRGFLRLYGRYPFATRLEATLGYRANLFDRFRYPDAEILQRYDAGLAANLPSSWKAYAEAAVLQAAGREDDTPVLLGVQHPAGKIFDAISAETEWLKDRKAAGHDREWLLNLHARKVAGRLKLDLGAYSDPADRDWNAFLIGLRITSNIR